MNIIINKYYCACGCVCKHNKKKHKKADRLTLTKRVQIHKLIKKGPKHMTEIQKDQFAEISYTFTDDGVPTANNVDVFSIEVVSSNPEFLTVEALPKVEDGVYPFKLNWAGIGVGTVNLTALKVDGDTSPIVDQEAFSTIPNLAVGVAKNIVVNEL